MDSEVVVDVAPELAEIVFGRPAGWVAPAGHGEYAGEIDGLGVGHDRCDRVARGQPAGQRVVAEKRADQRFPPIIVQAVACPEGGDVGRVGEGVCRCLAAVVSGQSVVASLGMKDVGQVADVVLPAAGGCARGARARCGASGRG